MFISIGIRVLVNVEALNMVEAIGNVTRHRTVPYIYRRGEGRYVIQWVPVLSGEAIAHAYQEYLVDLAVKNNLSVCYWCRAKEFIKHFDLRFWRATSSSISGYTKDELDIAQKYAEQAKLSINQMKEIESAIVKTCVVEDICGFLVTQGPVKRTSRVLVSYAIPTLDSVEKGAVAIDNQFFVRHAPQAETYRGQLGPIQAPYYVQTASAIYGFTVAIDLDSIGISSIDGSEIVTKNEIDRRKRIALEALREMLDSRIFGAKLSRFTPMIDYEIVIAIVSKNIKLMVSPPTLRLEDFIKDNVVRAVKAASDTGDTIKVLIWCKQNEINSIVEKVLKPENLGIDKDKIEKIVERIVSPSIRDLLNRIIEIIGFSK